MQGAAAIGLNPWTATSGAPAFRPHTGETPVPEPVAAGRPDNAKPQAAPVMQSRRPPENSEKGFMMLVVNCC
jgi:hypothetical protein